MVDSWNPAVLNETTQDIDSWNPAELNKVTTKVDSWNPAILNKNLESAVPVVFSATITASFPEGATCTATDGTTTLTADDNPMAFDIPNEGTWAVACVANGVTFSEDVVIDTDGQTETVNLTPDGETVTPTDSVPVLIACAGIGDSTYTTIAEVIADSEMLTEITTNDNTIAYLVRSTTFADSITADEDAMTAIGASNECSDALLGNSTWLNAICNSTYFESVLNVKVPTMTGYTTPEGQIIYTSTRSDDPAWKAFDRQATAACYTQGATDGYIGYVFDNNVKVYYADIQSHNQYYHSNFQIQSSDDGVSYVNRSSVVNNAVPETMYHATVTPATSCRYWRVLGTNPSGPYEYMRIVQFYGRQDVNI